MEALLRPRISAILQSHVYPRFGRVLRALARVKSALLGALGKAKWGTRRRRRRRRSRKQQQQRAKKRRSSRRQQLAAASTGGGGGGFANDKRPPPHLTWPGGGGGLSPARTAGEMARDVYPSCESVWNAVVAPAAAAAAAPSEYCGYLRWLEEEMPGEAAVVVEEGDDSDVDATAPGNEIDRLAEQFIARCRANFLLEKQESYDRWQEMIARSL